MSILQEPITVGELRLPNRIVMAPLTRNRANMPGRVPNALMRDYYVQRASAGMIITEATSVDPAGGGYPSTPGIWRPSRPRAGAASSTACTPPAAASSCSSGTWAASRTRSIMTGAPRSRQAPSRQRGT
jgi:2,4-dienoyl-CoA reductase-like NADH-dependent reductase (Old Yellow Enzyme family)